MIPNPALCPANLCESIDAYVQQGRPVGSFLEAVLMNDLLSAVNRADEANLALLPHIVTYVYRHVPLMMWGSEKKLAAQLQKGRRLAELTRQLVGETP